MHVTLGNTVLYLWKIKRILNLATMQDDKKNTAEDDNILSLVLLITSFLLKTLCTKHQASVCLFTKSLMRDNIAQI